MTRAQRLALVAAAAAALALVLVPPAVAADEPLATDAIFGAPRPFSIDSVSTRFSHYAQSGHGYQSQAGGPPGSEELTVEQPQVEVIAHQGDRITHRIWVPVDVVSAASPDALDAVSTASRVNEAGAVELASSWQATRATAATIHGGFHLEEPYRSWDVGAALAHSFADDNAVVAASVDQYFDWLDTFDIHGTRLERAGRSSTNFNLGITQLLSPTTFGHHPCSVSGSPAAILGAIAAPVILAGAAVSVAGEVGRRTEERAPDGVAAPPAAGGKHARPNLALVPEPPDPYREPAGKKETRRKPSGAFQFNETATNVATAVTGAMVVGAIIADIVHESSSHHT